MKLIILVATFFIFTSNCIAQELLQSLFYSTIRLECYENDTINGHVHSIKTNATGFFFILNIDGNYTPTIVTTAHAVKQAEKVILTFTASKKDTFLPDNKRTVIKRLSSFNKYWIYHPTYDLAICPLAAIFGDKIYNSREIYYKAFSEQNIVNLNKQTNGIEINSIEDILMIGYPKGIWDSVNNLPILRKGITATPLPLNYLGKSQILADIPVYGGSSGSPVLLYKYGTFFGNNSIIANGGEVVFLMGICSEDLEGNFSSKNDSNNMITKLPLNLAIVIKAERILDFVDIIKNHKK